MRKIQNAASDSRRGAVEKNLVHTCNGKSSRLETGMFEANDRRAKDFQVFRKRPGIDIHASAGLHSLVRRQVRVNSMRAPWFRGISHRMRRAKRKRRINSMNGRRPEFCQPGLLPLHPEVRVFGFSDPPARLQIVIRPREYRFLRPATQSRLAHDPVGEFL